MIHPANDHTHSRSITPIERYFSHSPMAIVSVAARLRGQVGEEALRDAVVAAVGRHPILGCRIHVDDDGQPWFTSDGAESPTVLIEPRQSADHWLQVVARQSQRPFDFERRPPLRIVLLQGAKGADLLLVCHHIICDGLSLAYLMRDLLTALGQPAGAALEPTSPRPIELDSIPGPARPGWLMSKIVGRINGKWAPDKVRFGQDDYVALNQAYWQRYRHDALSITLTRAQTKQLVQHSRALGITVTSALTSAFASAGQQLLGPARHGRKLGVAVNLRERLTQPPGEVMGFYAGLAQLDYKHQPKAPFADNAKRLHRAFTKSLTDKQVFRDPALWCLLDPTVVEAINFKRLGGLVADGDERSQALHTFASKRDVVRKILSRKGLDQLETTVLGTAVTNLTRLDIPAQYGGLELERLFLYPGSALPLANVPLVVGVVTCADRMSIVLQHEQGTVTPSEAQDIARQALQHLELESSQV